MCDWVHKVATKPVWSKMSPNVTDIKMPARSSLSKGQQAFSCSMHSLPGLPSSIPGACGFTPGLMQTAGIEGIAAINTIQRWALLLVSPANRACVAQPACPPAAV